MEGLRKEQNILPGIKEISCFQFIHRMLIFVMKAGRRKERV